MGLNLKKIGGSDMAAVLGCDPWGKTAYDVWLRIVEGVHAEQTDYMRKGKLFEQAIAQWWSLDRGVDIEWINYSLEPPDRPWQRMTLDLRVRSMNAIADIKRYNYDRAAALGAPGTDQVGDYEQIQLQTYMEGLNHLGDSVEQALLIVHNLWDDELLEYRIPYNEELGGIIVEEAERFWRDHIETGIPPAVSGTKTARNYLEGRLPLRPFKPSREATPDEHALALKLRALTRDAKKIEDEIDVVKNSLRDLIGPTEKVRGDWGSISWVDVPETPVSYTRGAYRMLKPHFKAQKER